MVIVSPSRTAAIGPPSAASGAMWPAMKPRVAPEKRPSVSSATRLAEALPHERRGDREHLAHARAADRALVADDDDVARLDLAGGDRLHRVLLALEHARGALVVAALVARELHDAALGRDVAAQDREPAGRLDRVVERADDLLAVGLLRLGGVLADRLAGDGRRVRVQQPGLDAGAARARRDAAGGVQVGGEEAPARLEVAQQSACARRSRRSRRSTARRPSRARPRAGAARRWSSRRWPRRP